MILIPYYDNMVRPSNDLLKYTCLIVLSVQILHRTQPDVHSCFVLHLIKMNEKHLHEVKQNVDACNSMKRIPNGQPTYLQVGVPLDNSVELFLCSHIYIGHIKSMYGYFIVYICNVSVFYTNSQYSKSKFYFNISLFFHMLFNSIQYFYKSAYSMCTIKISTIYT